MTRNCLSMTFHFHSNGCQLFDQNEDVSADNNMYLSYGYLSAINYQLIYNNNTNRWRFIEEEEIDFHDNQETKTKSFCQTSINASSEIDSFYNPNCFLSDINGCNQLTGCQQCLKTKSSVNEKNLPICPMTTNLQQEKEVQEKKENICMTKCFLQRNPPCIAIEFDKSTSDCQYITSYDDWKPIGGRKRRYWLQYPQQEFQFIPNCDLHSSSSIVVTFDQCSDSCQRDVQCQKFSYDYQTHECKMANDRPGYLNKNSKFQNRHCFIRPFLVNNNFTSMRMAFERTLDSSFADQTSYLKRDIISCPPTSSYDTCLDTCLYRCLFDSPLNLTCQYVSIKYNNPTFTCTYFQNSSDVIQDESGEIYTRYFNSRITLDVIDDMPIFYPSTDTRECFYPASLSSNEQTYSTLNGYQTSLMEVNQSVSVIRQRRFLGFLKKAAKWVGDKIVKPIINTAKDIVETPIKAVKTLDHLVKGDKKAAKDEFMSIGIVKDVKSLGENAIKVGKAIGKGDVKGALEGLANVGLDALAVVPLPGVGKVASKIGKGMKSSVDKARTNVKDQIKKPTPRKNDKKKKEHCKRRTMKRQLAESKHDRDCDDDDDRDQPRCGKPPVNKKDDKIITRSLDNCHAKSIGSKCKYDCEFLYERTNDVDAVCHRDTANKKRGIWKPTPKCEPESCPNNNYPMISIKTNDINAYVVLFDKKRKLPIWSMCILDKQNDLITPAGKRKKGYPHHPCKELKNSQANQKAYTGSGYDHGHLTPSEILSYSRDASYSSNLRINLAPQNAITNQIPWRMLEAHIRCHNHKYPPSVVVTGVCPKDRGKTKAIDGVEIPSCFWKLICYKRHGQTHVVGFISDNSKLTRKDRTEFIKIFTPVSQAEILTHLKSDPTYFTSNPFVTGFASAAKNRASGLSINGIECAKTMVLDKTEADIWHKDLLMEQEKRDETALKKKNKKKKNKSKRQTNNKEVRGCTPDEARNIAALFGLSSLSIFDDANYDIVEGDEDDDDDTPDEGGDNISQGS